MTEFQNPLTTLARTAPSFQGGNGEAWPSLLLLVSPLPPARHNNLTENLKIGEAIAETAEEGEVVGSVIVYSTRGKLKCWHGLGVCLRLREMPGDICISDPGKRIPPARPLPSFKGLFKAWPCQGSFRTSHWQVWKG